MYAAELGQHPQNAAGSLTDALDIDNAYLVADLDGQLVGCISLTRPGAPALSIEKYLDRSVLPFPLDASVLEVRLLTVPAGHRGSEIAGLLMLGAFRLARSLGVDRMVVMGRREIVPMYRRAGFTAVGIEIRCGVVDFEILTATVGAVAAAEGTLPGLRRRAASCRWDLPTDLFPARAEPAGSAPCFHGGAFFTAIGEDFADLGRRHAIVNADVLDAWFPPAPAVTEALSADLGWLVSTSPPTQGTGLVEAIGRARGVPAASVLPGAGSSALIFLAFGRWLTPASRVLLLDPCYGEYAHVLEQVVGCRVDRFLLTREHGYDYRAADLVQRAAGYDLVVLVNPNSPTGRHVPAAELTAALAGLDAATRVWIDETYVDYVHPSAPPGVTSSLERYAAASESVVVVKSMSKAYALSGLRVAYLVGAPDVVDELRRWTPPWAVGLPGQVAAVRALSETAHYRDRWLRTAALRHTLAQDLSALGAEVVPGVANFLLAHLPPAGPTAAQVVARCRRQGVFLRDVGAMGTGLGTHALRVAVKDPAAAAQITSTLSAALGSPHRSRPR